MIFFSCGFPKAFLAPPTIKYCILPGNTDPPCLSKVLMLLETWLLNSLCGIMNHAFLSYAELDAVSAILDSFINTSFLKLLIIFIYTYLIYELELLHLSTLEQSIYLLLASSGSWLPVCSCGILLDFKDLHFLLASQLTN